MVLLTCRRVTLPNSCARRSPIKSSGDAGSTPATSKSAQGPPLALLEVYAGTTFQEALMAATRRADMFIDLADDPRENGPRLGDERTTLVEALRCERLTLEIKCADLDAEQMAR